MSLGLKTSCDRKVRMYKTQHNSFGCLPGPPSEGGTCVGCTSGQGGCWETVVKGGKERVCYADKIRRGFVGAARNLSHNTRLLKEATLMGKMDLFDDMFDEFEDACERYEKRTGDKKARYFRLYWSGDVADAQTALALVASIKAHPSVRFWTYTRSFDLVPILLRAPNLKLFVSLDAVNYKEGMRRFGKLNKKGKVSFAYMGDTNAYNFVPCPVDSGKMPLDGACRKCMLCVRTNHDKNIWFNIK